MPEPTLRTRYSSSISSDDGTMGNYPLPVSRASNDDQWATLNTPPVSAPRGVSREFRERGYEVGRGDLFPAQGDLWGTGQDDDDDDESGCVTLAITTCKRLRAFLGTAEGLQACSFEGACTRPSQPRIYLYSLNSLRGSSVKRLSVVLALSADGWVM